MDQMNGFFMTLIPLLLFVVVDIFWGMRAALISAVVAALLEAVFSFYYFGELDFLTGMGVSLVVIMAGVAWKLDSPIMFKMQPVLLGTVTSAFLIGTTLYGRPLLTEALKKYGPVLNPQFSTMLENPQILAVIDKSNWTIGVCLLIHAGFVAWTALRCSNWIWLVARGVGVYIAMFLGMILAAWT